VNRHGICPPIRGSVSALTQFFLRVRRAGVRRVEQCPGGSKVDIPRRLSDLPIAGGRVRLLLLARRFNYDAVLCVRRIFTERFDAARTGAIGAANRSARPYRASSRTRFGRSTGRELRPPFDVAGPPVVRMGAMAQPQRLVTLTRPSPRSTRLHFAVSTPSD